MSHPRPSPTLRADIAALVTGADLALPIAPPAPTLRESLTDQFLSYIGTAGESADATPERQFKKQLDSARALCRGGNPFPLIAIQWPNLLVTDPAESQHFAGTIGDPLNPCLRLDNFQRDIIGSFFDESIREVFTKGCVGAGKGTSASICFCLAFDVWKCRIILTSASYDHAVDTIFAEVVKWFEQMKHPQRCKVKTESIVRSRQHQIVVKNPQTGEGFSGKHGEMIVFGFDEASGTRRLLYDNAKDQFHKIMALSNPRTLHGWFRKGFDLCADIDKTQTVTGPFGLRRCITVAGADCLNVRAGRLDKPIAPKGGIEIDGVQFAQFQPIPPAAFAKVRSLIPDQTDTNRYQGLLAGDDQREIDIKAHGKFPTEDPLAQLILGSWLDRHVSAWRVNMPVEAFGLDVAASKDGDKTILSAGGWAGVAGISEWKLPDTMQTVAWAIESARVCYGIDLKLGQVPICVDTDGLGKGVADRLRELGCWVIEYHGNGTSTVNPRRYGNLRAESHGELGRRLDPNGPWPSEPWALPPGAVDLLPELTAPQKIFSGSDGLRFYITPKRRHPGLSAEIRTIKEILGRSPDMADSVACLFHACLVLYRQSRWKAAYEGELVAWPPVGTANDGSKLVPTSGDYATQQRLEAESAAARAKLHPQARELIESLQEQDRKWQQTHDDNWG